MKTNMTTNWQEEFDKKFGECRDENLTDGTLLAAQKDKGDGRTHWQTQTIKAFISSLLSSLMAEVEAAAKKLNNSLPSDGWNEWEQGQNQAYEHMLAIMVELKKKWGIE